MTLRLLTLFCCLSFTLMTSAQMSGGQIRRSSPNYNQATKKKPVSSNSNYIKIKNGWGVENRTYGGVAWKYEGEFKDGKYNGKGTMTYPYGSVYEGEWKDGERNGHGKQTFADGEVYEGGWKDGSFNGYGKRTWPDGRVYEGEWKHGDFNGYGKYTWADGDVYEGEWKDGKRTGYGKYTWPNGHVYEGEFKDGELNGHGKYTDADGGVYEGEYKDGKKNGKGVEMWPKEKNYAFRLECYYFNNKREGVGTWYFNNHTYRTCIFEDGKEIKTIEEGTWK